MKKKLTVLLAALMLFTAVFSSPATAYAASAADEGLYVKFYKPYIHSKDKKTYFPLKLYNQSEHFTAARYELRSSSGKVLAKWNAVDLGPNRVLKQWPRCNMKNYPAGTCYFYTYVQHLTDSNWYYWKQKVYNGAGGIKIKQPTLRRNKSGKIVPKIRLSYTNLKGKYLFMEILTMDGEKVCETKNSKPLKTKNGEFWFSWNGRRKGELYPSGTYRVRMAFSGGKWVEKQMYLDFSRAR